MSQIRFHIHIRIHIRIRIITEIQIQIQIQIQIEIEIEIHIQVQIQIQIFLCYVHGIGGPFDKNKTAPPPRRSTAAMHGRYSGTITMRTRRTRLMSNNWTRVDEVRKG